MQKLVFGIHSISLLHWASKQIIIDSFFATIID